MSIQDPACRRIRAKWFGLLVVSVPVVTRVRFVVRACDPGMKAEAQLKPERKEHGLARRSDEICEPPLHAPELTYAEPEKEQGNA